MKKDILNREEFINTIVDFVNTLSDLKRGYCFAIDGKWGSGKTFLLDKLEEKLRAYQSEETNDNQYFLFHYNCWQYDYYDEPAIAIVSAMLDAVEDEISFLGSKADGKISAYYEVLKKDIKKIAGKFIENHIGINIVEFKEKAESEEKQSILDKNKFDKLFNFKRTLDETREIMEEIAKDKTLVFVVDELDRCIPTYAIKVLERLHHLFDGLDNIIVIIAVDSQQLNHSVKEIYGSDTKAEEYLKKFIGLTFRLDTGKMTNGIFEKYNSYFQLFQATQGEKEKIEEIFSNIWNGVDIRTQEKLMEKALTIHCLVNTKVNDISLALFEILFVRFYNTYGKSLEWLAEINNPGRSYDVVGEIGKQIVEYLKKLKAETDNGTRKFSIRTEQHSITILQDTLTGRLFYILSKIYLESREYELESQKKCSDTIDAAKKFITLINFTN